MKYKMETNGFSSELEYGKLDISGQSEFGFRPFQLLVSSIAGCSGGVLRKVLEKMRIPFDDIEIEVEVKRSEGEVKTVDSILLTFLIYGDKLKEEKVAKALEVALKNCAMAQSVKGAITIEKDFKLIQNK
jgi:putative redox protein